MFLFDFMFHVRQILRRVVGVIDGLLYSLDAELYDLMMDIAGAKIFKQETILEVSGRIYQLLGLIMLFKLIFSFITYIINPDDMTDKNKGYANLIKKIIISLCLIVITPWAFTQSRNLQIYIIEDKVIEYFVFGQTKPSNATPGYNFMYTVGKVFITPYQCANDKCTPYNDIKTSTKKLCDSKWDENLPSMDSDYKVTSGNEKCGYGASEYDYAKTLSQATKLDENGKYNLSSLMQLGSYGNDGNGWDSDFYADVKFPFIGTTLVGIMIGYMLIVMCIDVAVRSVKLGFYEIIAPIPIISYVGFKDGKDSMLNKWFGQVTKTYADLFTRIAGLQIAIFFIDLLMEDGIEKNGFFVSLFLILGALTFAKELPKILEGMGIKFSGGGFNLKKKFTDNMVGGKQILGGSRRVAAGALGLAGGAVTGLASNFGARLKQQRAAGHKGGWGITRAVASSVAGAVTGGLRGAGSGLASKKGLNIGQSLNRAGQGARYIKAGSSFTGRTIGNIQGALGVDNRAKRMETTMKARADLKGKMDAFETELDKEARKNNFSLDGIGVDNIGGGRLTLGPGSHYAQVLSAIETAKARGVGSIRINGQAVGAHEYDAVIKGIRKQVYAQMTDGSGSLVTASGSSYTTLDAQLDYMMQEIDRDIMQSGDNAMTKANKSGYKGYTKGSGYAGQKAAVDEGQKATTREKAASGAWSYQRAQANAQFTGNKDKK